MNYKHIYHAGNFADIIKHLVLIACIENLKRKPAPFHVLDAFAGIGLYDLNTEEAQTTKEFETGIEALFREEIHAPPPLLDRYLQLVGRYYQDRKIYPGSPAIISESIRAIDRAEFCELHPEFFHDLQKNLRIFRNNFACHNIDAYISVKSLTPPKEKRGLIVLDPPFEVQNEFGKLCDAANIISKRYSQATVIIWYPIKDMPRLRKFYEMIGSLKREVLKIEFSAEKISTNLKSSGLIIINPPNIKNELNDNLSFLGKNLGDIGLRFLISNLS